MGAGEKTVQKQYISTKTVQKRNTNGTTTEQQLHKSDTKTEQQWYARNVQNDKRGFHQRAPNIVVIGQRERSHSLRQDRSII